MTAHLLLEQGYEVEGLSFVLWEARNRDRFPGCCSLETVNSASNTAAQLGIKHYAVDVRGEFIEKIIGPFVDAYSKGMTPNPCILCNRYVKFPFLLREAEKRRAKYIATGHYARVSADEKSENNKYFLKKGIDQEKDQSYVLYVLEQNTLSRLILPLGDYRKVDIRKIARSLNLAAADRPESQEICFIEDKNYYEFIDRLSSITGEPGPILDMTGKVIGTHKGICRYTIGQRKGLGISSLQPHYVVRIDAVKNAIYAGPQEAAKTRSFYIENINWIIDPPDSFFRATVKVRSMMEDRPALVEIRNDGVKVIFNESQWAPAPGQSAVIYHEEAVIGGGIIV